MQYIRILLVLYIITYSDALRAKDAMYDSLQAVAACFRRMNGTHQMGCSSDRGGSTGVVHFAYEYSDLEVLFKIKNNLDYVPVVPDSLLNDALITQLQALDYIAGVIIYKANNTLKHFTHDDQCPNRYSNVKGTCDTRWNRYGTNLLNRDIKFPLFYIDRWLDIDKVHDCFQRFNNFSFETHTERPLCSLELDSFMFAAIDTPTCIRRSNSRININPIKFCDPLGDRNIWASLYPVGATADGFKPAHDMKYIIVAARIDTTSMFNELTPGGQNPITGLVALLNTARLLKKMIPTYENYNKNVLFVIFNGESYDYIGSQRFLYDMETNQFPSENFTTDTERLETIHLNDISLYIELNQISKTNQLHAHYITHADMVSTFFNIMKSQQPNMNLTENIERIPPSSLHTFMKSHPQFPGLVITDHNQDYYANNFYNSIYDDARHLDYTYANISDSEIFIAPTNKIQNYLVDVTHMLARSLYKEITGAEPKIDAEDNESLILIDELFHCYLENANCKIHRAVTRQEFSNHPFSLYVGVPRSSNAIVDLVRLTLAWFVGDLLNKEPCQYDLHSQIYKYYNMSMDIAQLNATCCFRVCMNMTEAISPAFILDEYDWSSGQYSTWSESVWHDLGVRLFLRPTKQHEVIVFSIGLIVFVLSTILTYFIHSKSFILFETNTVSPTSC